jgi:hypothetical protein
LAFVPSNPTEGVDDDLTTVLARVEPELSRLMAAGLVARIGEEYEFPTGERRTFEEEVTTIEQQYMQQDRERGLKDHAVLDAPRRPGQAEGPQSGQGSIPTQSVGTSHPISFLQYLNPSGILFTPEYLNERRRLSHSR